VVVIKKLRAMLLLLTAAALTPVPHKKRIAAMRRILLRLLERSSSSSSSASWPKGSSMATISTLGALESLALTVMMIGRRVSEFIDDLCRGRCGNGVLVCFWK